MSDTMTAGDPHHLSRFVRHSRHCSSLTLFMAAGGGNLVEAALARWSGTPDPATLHILADA